MSWVVIPFRGPEGAKTRLAEAMSEEARATLARAMFQHVLSVCCEAAGRDHVMVVTASRTAAKIAQAAGAVVVKERSSDLNGALSEAREALRRRHAPALSIVAADLPLLTADDVGELMEWARPERIMVAMDRRRSGTNGLALPVAGPFDFKFGPDSAVAHAREARLRHLAVRSMRQEGFAADVDTPADLELLRKPNALASLPGLAAGAFRGVR